MLSEIARQWLASMLDFSIVADNGVTSFAVTITAVALGLLVWRLWTFSVFPALHPNEPKELPYWVPFLGTWNFPGLLKVVILGPADISTYPGHAREFLANSEALFTRGRLYFGNTREPFTITLLGEKIYIVTSAQDVTAIYKNSAFLTFDSFVQDTMHSFGASASAVHKTWERPAPAGRGPILLTCNPQHKCFFDLADDLHKNQLRPGEELNHLRARYLAHIDEALRWPNIGGASALAASRPYREISLLQWCKDVIIDAGSRAYFEDCLLEIEPNLYQILIEFDDNCWMLFYQYPRVVAKRMYEPKAKLHEALTAYFKMPPEKRQGAARFIRMFEAEQRHLGIEEEDIAAMILMLLLALNTNTYKHCFWMFAYILRDPSLQCSLKSEISTVMTGSDFNIDQIIERCPLLDSVYYESLRLTNGSGSIRSVAHPITIGGKLLRAGRKVMMPYRQLHLDADIWGPNAEEFDAARFMKNKDLRRSPHFRPFAGGSTYCPGRFMAKQETMAFVALALHRFDIELAGVDGDGPGGGDGKKGEKGEKAGKGASRQTFPTLDVCKPTLGMIAPVQGSDYILRVREAGK